MRQKINGVCDYCERFTILRRAIDPSTGDQGEWYCRNCIGEDGAVDMDYKDEQPGTLEEGTETHLGVIQGSSFTAYYINDVWVPFSVIHGTPKMVVPMVIFG